MMKAIAIDDEPLALELIQAFCADIEHIQLLKTFTSPKEALLYLRKFPVDLLFLDVRMPSMTGLDLYKQLQQDSLVIFTTAHSEYAVESYTLKAIDYLLKPYEQSRFKAAVSKAHEYFLYLNQSDKEKSKSIFIRADYKLIKVALSDILYIEGLGDYIKIVQLNQKTIVTRQTMKSILDALPVDEFVRVHRSFIVPVNQLGEMRNKKLLLGDVEIPIGVSYESDILNRFFQ